MHEIERILKYWADNGTPQINVNRTFAVNKINAVYPFKEDLTRCCAAEHYQSHRFPIFLFSQLTMSEILNSEIHREAIRMHLNRSLEDKLDREPNFELWGEGISNAVKVGGTAQFYVRSKTPDLLLMSIDVKDPDREMVDLGFHCLDENMHLLSFNVEKTGNYVMDVKWEGKPVLGSPFNVIVSNNEQ